MSDPTWPYPVNSRVIVGRDSRLHGFIECYEFPPTSGRAFIRCDNDHGYWCQHYDLTPEQPPSDPIFP